MMKYYPRVAFTPCPCPALTAMCDSTHIIRRGGSSEVRDVPRVHQQLRQVHPERRKGAIDSTYVQYGNADDTTSALVTAKYCCRARGDSVWFSFSLLFFSPFLPRLPRECAWSPCLVGSGTSTISLYTLRYSVEYGY